ncbi:MAG: hypothetical protein KAQ94_06300 [Arcobacteraceae bacterium]|nr:hypothetical protein [Arcobacteraceae bacterium]
MKKTIYSEKYPVYTLEINKDETTFSSIKEIIIYLKGLVDDHKIAKYIATFDNYEHTTSLGGEINPDIKDAQILIFCFGPAIPNTKILAVRPRSVGIAELENSFIIEFLEAPKEQLNDLMETWAKSIANK